MNIMNPHTGYYNSSLNQFIGPERIAIQRVLGDVNWETLCDQLNLRDQVAAINTLCNTKIDIRPCCLREVISRYIQSQGVESCDSTRKKIAKALEDLGYVNEASRLRERELLTCSACKHPQSDKNTALVHHMTNGGIIVYI